MWIIARSLYQIKRPCLSCLSVLTAITTYVKRSQTRVFNCRDYYIIYMLSIRRICIGVHFVSALATGPCIYVMCMCVG